MPNPSFWLWLTGSYLLGSLPFGLLIGKAQGVDLRAHGSGNIGATNAGRILGKKWGLICFALDVMKGFIPAFLAATLADHGAYWTAHEATHWQSSLLWLGIGFASVIGHCFPCWLKFRGGKGVATSLGALLGFWPVMSLPALGAFAIWLLAVNLSGYVGLASVVAAICLPPLALASSLYFRHPWQVFLGLSLPLALLVVWKHRSNLRNISQGTEIMADWTLRAQRKQKPPVENPINNAP